MKSQIFAVLVSVTLVLSQAPPCTVGWLPVELASTGVGSAGSNLGANFPTESPAQAFSLSATTYWQSAAGNPSYIEYLFVQPTWVTGYSLTPKLPAPTRFPDAWRAEGSLDGVVFTLLDTASGNAASTTPVVRTAAAGQLLNIIRFTFTTGSSLGDAVIGQIRVQGCPPPPKAPCDPLAWLSVENPLTGVGSAGSTLGANFPNESPAEAFSTETTTYWQSAAGTPSWLAYLFVQPTWVTGYALQPRIVGAAATRFPDNWIFEGSIDGLRWAQLENSTGNAAATTPVSRTALYGMLVNTVRWRFTKGSATLDSVIGNAKVYGCTPLPTAPCQSSWVRTEKTLIGQGVAGSDIGPSEFESAYQAFTLASNTYWQSADGNPSHISFIFTQTTYVDGYTLTPYTAGKGATNFPAAWVFEASLDGTNWIEVDSRSGQAAATAEVVRTQLVGTPANVARWRFTTGSAANNAAIGSIKISGCVVPGNGAAVPKCGKGTWLAVDSSNVGVGSAGSDLGKDFPTESAAQAFSTSTRTYWQSKAGDSPMKRYLQYLFIQPTYVSSYSLAPHVQGNGQKTNFPFAWIFEGSVDGLTWITLHTSTGNSAAVGPVVKENLRPQLVNLVRWRFTSGNNPSGNDVTIGNARIGGCSPALASPCGESDWLQVDNSLIGQGVAGSDVGPTANESPAQAFSTSLLTYWQSAHGNPSFLQYIFTQSTWVDGYSLQPRISGGVTNFPDSWVFEASIDVAHWLVLDTSVGNAASTIVVIRTGLIGFLANTVRWRFTKGSAANNAVIAQARLQGCTPPPPSPCGATGWLELAGQGAAGSDFGPSANESPNQAFTLNGDTYWQSANNDPSYLAFIFTQTTWVDGYALIPYVTGVGATGFPDAWVFEGSVDGLLWTALDTSTGTSGSTVAVVRKNVAGFEVNTVRWRFTRGSAAGNAVIGTARVKGCTE